MAQTPPFPPGAYIVQAQKEEEGRLKSRGGVASPNPPSTNLPPSIKLESDVPCAQVPITGTVPFVNPSKTPFEALAGRTVNNAPPAQSMRIDLTDRSTPATSAGLDVVERSVNDAKDGKPEMPNVIARDSQQVVTNDQPPTPDHQ